MVHLDVFGEDGGRSSHHSDLENQWLQVVDYDEATGDQNGKPSSLDSYKKDIWLQCFKETKR